MFRFLNFYLHLQSDITMLNQIKKGLIIIQMNIKLDIVG